MEVKFDLSGLNRREFQLVRRMVAKAALTFRDKIPEVLLCRDWYSVNKGIRQGNVTLPVHYGYRNGNQAAVWDG